MNSRFLIPVFVLIFIVLIPTSLFGGLETAREIAKFFAPQNHPGVSYACPDCNLLIFTIDTLRADHISSYDYFQKTSPVIDSVAEKGITFTNAFSQIPHTPPSHWSIFTSLYSYKHEKFLPGENGTGLTTLSDILKDNGYLTSGFISSWILIGFNDEFDYFNGYGYKDKRRNKRFLSKKAVETTEAVLPWLENHSGERFFLWVHYFDPHSPYDPPEEYDIYNYTVTSVYSDAKYEQIGLSRTGPIRGDIAKYDGEVRYSDENIGIVLKKLEELGLINNTLVIITADHGECFGEHNFSNFGYEEEKPCIFHGKTLYDEEIHVPFVIFNPHSPSKNVKINDLVETVDIMPTVLDILGITNEPEIDGETLVPLIRGVRKTKNYSISQTRPIKNRAFSIGIRTNEWKFVIMAPGELELEKDIAEQEGKSVNFTDYEGEAGAPVKKLLFNVNEGENKNYVEVERDVAGALESQLRDAISVRGFPKTVSIDEKTEDLLKSLGYI